MTETPAAPLTTQGETRPYLWAVLFIADGTGRRSLEDRASVAIHMTEKDALLDAVGLANSLLEDVGHQRTPAQELVDDEVPLRTLPEGDLRFILEESLLLLSKLSGLEPTLLVVQAVAEKEPMIGILKDMLERYPPK